MSYLTREQILGASDLGMEDVPVPEWGGVVRIRGLTGAERDAFEEGVIRFRGLADQRRPSPPEVRLINIRARMVSLAAVDGDGRRLFSEHDVAELGKKSAAALSRLFDVATRLAGMTAGEVETLEKNSVSDLDAGSGSG